MFCGVVFVDVVEDDDSVVEGVIDDGQDICEDWEVDFYFSDG